MRGWRDGQRMAAQPSVCDATGAARRALLHESCAAYAKVGIGLKRSRELFARRWKSRPPCSRPAACKIRDAARAAEPDRARAQGRQRHRRRRLRDSQGSSLWRLERPPWDCPRTSARQCRDPQPHPTHIDAPRSDHLARMARVTPPGPCRDRDTTCIKRLGPCMPVRAFDRQVAEFPVRLTRGPSRIRDVRPLDPQRLRSAWRIHQKRSQDKPVREKGRSALQPIRAREPRLAPNGGKGNPLWGGWRRGRDGGPTFATESLQDAVPPRCPSVPRVSVGAWFPVDECGLAVPWWQRQRARGSRALRVRGAGQEAQPRHLRHR
jgi:hypothetical protein